MRDTLVLALSALMLSSGCGQQHDDSEAGDLFSAAFEENTAPKADGASCSGVVVPDQGGFEKRVALTFDDGPNPATTPKVLEILRKHDLPATFFINGVRVNSPRAEAIVKDIAADPRFILANHTWSHQNMKTLSADAAASQIDRTTEVIERAGGESRYFRFPFGSSSCQTMAMIRDRQFVSTGWHVDSADWCFAPDDGHCKESTFQHVPDSMRDDMLGWTMQQARQRNGGIILFHDIHQFTADNIESVILTLEEQGFTFTSIDDLAAFPVLNGVPSRFIGDPCDTDDDCNFSGGFCVPDPEVPGGYCAVSCSGSCPDRLGHPTTRCVEAPDASGATTGLCAIECNDGCREGLECRRLTGRDVCWAP